MKIENIIKELNDMSMFYSEEKTQRVIELTHDFIMEYGKYFPNPGVNLDFLQDKVSLLNKILHGNSDYSMTMKSKTVNGIRSEILTFIKSIELN